MTDEVSNVKDISKLLACTLLTVNIFIDSATACGQDGNPKSVIDKVDPTTQVHHPRSWRLLLEFVSWIGHELHLLFRMIVNFSYTICVIVAVTRQHI